jgi:hypothetical protein
MSGCQKIFCLLLNRNASFAKRVMSIKNRLEGTAKAVDPVDNEHIEAPRLSIGKKLLALGTL